MNIPKELKRKHFTLNTWDDAEIANAVCELQNGYYVHMGSTAIGHTLANMVESEALRRIMAHFDCDREIEIVRDDCFGSLYLHKTDGRNKEK